MFLDRLRQFQFLTLLSKEKKIKGKLGKKKLYVYDSVFVAYINK